MREIAVLLVGLAAVGIASCSTAAGQTPQPVDAATVDMPPSYRFDPPVVRVAVGTTVTWRNSDHFTHSVKFAQGDFPYLDLRPGESGSITFDQPGEYDYICTYHAQNMKGKIVVGRQGGLIY